MRSLQVLSVDFFATIELMTGKLIFVSGLTGAGKTTLVGKALDNIDNLKVLLTYVTRPMRQGEEDSYEYVFVNDEQYDSIKKLSSNWDETIFHDVKYGSDAEIYKRDLQLGVNIIVSVTPDMDDINTMANIYDTRPITIWIDTTPEIAASRVTNDLDRSSRAEDDSVKSYFDIIFTPADDLNKDSTEFIKLIQSLINS